MNKSLCLYFALSPFHIRPSSHCFCHCCSGWSPHWSEIPENQSGCPWQWPRKRKLVEVGRKVNILVHFIHLYIQYCTLQTDSYCRHTHTHTPTCDGVEYFFGKRGIHWVAMASNANPSSTPTYTNIISRALQEKKCTVWKEYRNVSVSYKNILLRNKVLGWCKKSVKIYIFLRYFTEGTEFLHFVAQII